MNEQISQYELKDTKFTQLSLGFLSATSITIMTLEEQLSITLPCSATGLLANIPAPLYSAVTPDSSPQRGQSQVKSLSPYLSTGGLSPAANNLDAPSASSGSQDCTISMSYFQSRARLFCMSCVAFGMLMHGWFRSPVQPRSLFFLPCCFCDFSIWHTRLPHRFFYYYYYYLSVIACKEMSPETRVPLETTTYISKHSSFLLPLCRYACHLGKVVVCKGCLFFDFMLLNAF